MRCTAPALALSACAASCGSGEPDDSELRAHLAGSNVLITLIDAAAAGHIATYGYERDTMPFFERLASESVVFEDASATASFTLASVASLMTGEAPDRHLVWIAGREVPADLPMMAEAFQEAGYETHGISCNAHIHKSFGFNRGFDRFRYTQVELGRGKMAVPDASLTEIEAFFEAERQDPFFAYWHFLPPHAPYDPPEPFADTFAQGVDPALGRRYWRGLPRSGFSLSEEEVRDLIALYDSTLTYIDGVLEDIHAQLVDAGVLDDTIWIVLSDHGETFGEHDTFEHGSTVQEELVRVPLLVRLPGGLQGGRNIAEPVSLVDLFPTLSDLLLDDAPAGSAGVSMAPLLASERDVELEREAPIFYVANISQREVGLRRGAMKLVHLPKQGVYNLYDLERDPGELEDLAEQDPELFEEMRIELDTRMFGWKMREADLVPSDLDPEMERQLRAIGYGGVIDAARAAEEGGEH